MFDIDPDRAATSEEFPQRSSRPDAFIFTVLAGFGGEFGRSQKIFAYRKMGNVVEPWEQVQVESWLKLLSPLGEVGRKFTATDEKRR